MRDNPHIKMPAPSTREQSATRSQDIRDCATVTQRTDRPRNETSSTPSGI
ncbi:hypothetical protein [Frankia sp. QA3]|nr:hypothetical protein [Frankia sp. QA3]